MSEKQHTLDEDNKLKHVGVKGDPEGGHCLNRHHGRAEHSCSHQWQGFKKAVDTHNLYDWPKYESIGPRKLTFFKMAEEGQSCTADRHLAQPGEGDWDVGKTCPRNGETNHKEHCNTPYYHEAHHIIPNSTLNGTIQDTFGESARLVLSVRRGLLNEGYNLNHKDNMILLPMDQAVSEAIGLPRHREFSKRSHRVYSAHVVKKVKKILQANAEKVANCKLTEYVAMKEELVELSKTLFERIKNAGADRVGSLDDMEVQRFQGI